MEPRRQEPQLNLTCGDLDLTPISGRTGIKQTREGNTIVSRLTCDVRRDPSLLFQLDLRATLRLEDVSADHSPVARFTGLSVMASGRDGDSYRLYAEDMSVRIQEAKTGGAFGTGISPPEMIYLLMSSVEGVDTDPQHIHGLHLSDSRRAFVFIAPIPGISIKGDEAVRIADIELYVPAKGMRYDDDLIQKAAPEPLAPELSPEVTRAYVPVLAHGFTEAIVLGQARLSQAIDWLSFRCGLSTPCYRAAGEWRFIQWDRTDGLAHLVETDWVYIRDTLPVMARERYWLRWSPPAVRDSIVQLGGQSDPRATETLELVEKTLTKQDEDRTPAERSLLLALHFHRRARQSPDRIDQIVNYWHSLEFILSPYGDGPLRGRWKHFWKQHGLSLLETDEAFLWDKMRKLRNRIEHGDEFQQMTQIDLDHLGCIAEKAVLTAAAGLHSSGDVSSNNEMTPQGTSPAV